LSEIEFRPLSLPAAVETAIAEWHRRDGVGRVYRFLNAHTIALADTDPRYRDLLRQSSLNHPDGKPVALFLRWVRGRGFRQVRGPDFFTAALAAGVEQGIRHFFLGGSEETLKALQQRAAAAAPGLKVVGAYSPPFGARSDAEVASQDAAIKAARPDVVWVGLGTPKQDYEAARLAVSLGVNAAAVGAAFDFAAGTKREASPVLRQFGLEWLFRLATEPRRLLWRYLWGNTRFLAAALRAAAPRKNGPHRP
jgi:N-acetylglucosaminyldiphosphoundecaprenol N-acetyl-beta-D-mannosaminyltransferase